MNHSKPRYPLVEAFKLLGLSRSKGYLRVREGRLKVVRDGDAPFVTAEAIEEYAAKSHPKVDYTPACDRLTVA
jgi:hypothetical protein